MAGHESLLQSACCWEEVNYIPSKFSLMDCETGIQMTESRWQYLSYLHIGNLQCFQLDYLRKLEFIRRSFAVCGKRLCHVFDHMARLRWIDYVQEMVYGSWDEDVKGILWGFGSLIALWWSMSGFMLQWLKKRSDAPAKEMKATTSWQTWMWTIHYLKYEENRFCKCFMRKRMHLEL